MEKYFLDPTYLAPKLTIRAFHLVQGLRVIVTFTSELVSIRNTTEMSLMAKTLRMSDFSSRYCPGSLTARLREL